LADRGEVTLERQLERDRAALAGYHRSMACDRGDFVEYWHLRDRARRIREEARASRARGQASEATVSMARLRPGDVVVLPRGSRRGLAVVIGVRDGRPTLFTEDRRFFRAQSSDFDRPPKALARLDLPR